MIQTAWPLAHAVGHDHPRHEGTAPASPWEPAIQAACAVAYDLCSLLEDLSTDPRRVAGVMVAYPALHCGALHAVAQGVFCPRCLLPLRSRLESHPSLSA